MKDEWFKWEREASIQLLFPTLEGSMRPLEKFAGYGFPMTILIFKNGIATWCLRNTEFYELGAKLLKIYRNENKEREMAVEIAERLGVLNKIEEEIDGLNLSTLTSKRLVEFYDKLHDSFINYYGIGAIQEPVAMQAEGELKETFSLSDDKISHLVSPNKLSYTQEADSYLLTTKDIEGFIKKYYWIDNNYSQTKILSKDDVRKRLANIKPIEPLRQNFQSRKLNVKIKRLVQLLKNFTIYQDDRKKNILVYLHYVEILLKEIGKRSNISLNVMRDTFPHEIRDILNGKITGSFINERRKKCFIVWKEKASTPIILVGGKTKVWEKILTSKINNSRIIKGNCASKGKVTGVVRILLSASENNKLKDNEILVTFMTSPDFMPAIRRCSAIITNLGGVTSHAAIISRELKIPCIVGTKNATEILKTGDMAEVDANRGIVKILK